MTMGSLHVCKVKQDCLESLAGDSTEELCSDEALRLKDSEESQNLPPLPIRVRSSCLGLNFPEGSCPCFEQLLSLNSCKLRKRTGNQGLKTADQGHPGKGGNGGMDSWQLLLSHKLVIAVKLGP